MPRIFITGSTDGLGRAAAGVLMDEGHDVVLHARTHERTAALIIFISSERTMVHARNTGGVLSGQRSAVRSRSASAACGWRSRRCS